jgi:hypothetical protein
VKTSYAGYPNPTLHRVVEVHDAHLAALGAALPSTSATATPTGTAPSATDDASSAWSGAVQHARDEATAAREALRDGLAASGPFAVLLTRIAAARVVNADLLDSALKRTLTGVLRPAATPKQTPGPTSTATPTSTRPTTDDPAAPDPLRDPDSPALSALDRLLAGEHAAVFVYPLIVSRAAANRRDLALTLWQQHRTTRDELTAQLVTAGIEPTVAEPAYAVGAPPTSAAKAATLAVRVERGLAALAIDLLAAGAADDPYRVQGAAELVLAARRGASWSTPTPTPTVTPTPTSTTPVPIAPDRPIPGLDGPVPGR